MVAGRRLWLPLIICVFLGGIFFWFLAGRLTYLDPKVEINPGRLYTLDFWDYPLPLVWEDGTTYLEFVQEIIADFRDKYPNVMVNYHPLSFDGGQGELTHALQAGTPPDVYSEPFPRRIIHHQGLQIPITGYMVPEDEALYHPRVMALMEEKEDIWAWPIWVSPEIWVGNRQILEAGGLDLDQVQTLGWNWEDFYALAGEVKQVFGDIPAFFLGPEVKSFCNLLYNNGLIGNMDRDICLNMAEETAAFFHILYKEGLWQASEERQSWLKEFWEGRIAIVGPVNTWVIRGSEARIQQTRHDQEPVFLPPPHGIGAKEYMKPTVAQVSVFRQRRYRGADKVKAAMEFARFFSHRLGHGVAPVLWALPAYDPWGQVDNEGTELSAANIRFLLRSQNYLLPPTVKQNPWECEKWQKEVLAPRLQKLLKGEISPREFAALIEEELKNES